MLVRIVGVTTVAWGVVLMLAPGSLGIGIVIGIALIALGLVVLLHPRSPALPWLLAPVAAWWVVALVSADGAGEAALAFAMVALYGAAAVSSRRAAAARVVRPDR